MSSTAQIDQTQAQAGVSQLEQLKKFTTVVADTGDFESLKEFTPRDATTNPSLILKAAQMPAYKHLMDRAIVEGKKTHATGKALVANIVDDLLVEFGSEILKIVPGRVSTETDANLSFDTQGLIDKGHKFIQLYKEKGVPKERILVKIATTWEGVQAAKVLQKEGINCNMTLLFSLAQAVACAEADAKLISPFVGRILDWYKKSTGKDYAPAEDPGVVSVKEIYTYYKKYGHGTEVMGASFRNVGEILELAGSDLLTISPNLLAELKKSTAHVERKLSPELAKASNIARLELTESRYRFMVNDDPMATEKTAEGIRVFAADTVKLEKYIAERL